MKSINQIFRYNKHLMELQPVSELIEYCRDLEEQVIYNSQVTTNEQTLAEFVRELYASINEVLDSDNKDTDYKESLVNLKRYILEMNKEYGLNLI